MTRFPEIFARLAAPVPQEFIRVRKHDGAKYITARVVMNVLDTVLGPECWHAEYEHWSDNAVFCRLTITLPDGTRVTKGDVGSDTSMGEKAKGVDPGEDEKGGISDSFKRAAVCFGIGRFLYNDGIPSYYPGEVHDDPAPAPAPSQPADDGRHSAARPDRTQEPRGGHAHGNGERRTGKQMFAWVAEQDKKDPDLCLLKHMNEWSRREGHPFKMTEWPPDLIPIAYEEAKKHIRAVYGPGAAD